jgi:para-aminobenzoate synthetase component 1
MLKQVREPGAPFAFVGRTDMVPEVDRNDRRSMILRQCYEQTIVELISFDGDMHSRHFCLLNMPNALDAFEWVKRLPYPLLLDSASGSDQIARYSFVMADPDIVIRSWGKEVDIVDRRSGTSVRKEGRALDFAQELLSSYLDNVPTKSAPPNTELPPFHGGIAGYIGYEYGGVLERLPKPHMNDLAIPDVVVGIYPWVIAWDHVLKKTWLIAQESVWDAANDIVRNIQNRVNTDVDNSAVHSCSSFTTSDSIKPGSPVRHSSQVTREEYESAIEKIQEYIRAGDIFQANLSQRFSAPFSGDPWTLYRTLRTLNPAPFAAYFDFGDAVIVSASPERFLHLSPSGRVETRPIKGTRPRGKTVEEDRQNSTALLHSEKDAAEHVMIVDVLRNDISRVCEYGSVQVPALKVLESHATVHHLVSTITGQLRSNTTAIDLIHACFPGGSITGAPKVRAMEIIAELEPTARNVYCGSIGYVSTTGAMDSSIVIRTFTIKDGTAYFSAGGGIVADSVPSDEFQETLDKAKALINAISA